MIPNLSFIENRFNKFNSLCFQGKLKPITFAISTARKFLGQVAYMREKNPDGTWHYYQFIFKISNKFDLPEEVIEDTILHEMIHYYILSNQVQDTSSHGIMFQRIMNHINTNFNRHITISHKATKEEHDNDTEYRQHFVCVSTFCDGRVGVTVAARSRMFRLWEQMGLIRGIKEQKWYFTIDPYFNRFPRSLTPKIYKADKAELEQHLASASKLEKNGRYIKIKE